METLYEHDFEMQIIDRVQSLLTEGSRAINPNTYMIDRCADDQAWMQVVDQIMETLYEQTMDAQEGVIYYLLDQMADQHIKEVLVAYFILLSSGTC